MNITIDQVWTAILYVIAFVLSTTVHEYGHAWVATKLGDPTPKSQGRLSLSPLRHIDPIGTLLLPLFMHLGGGSVGGHRVPLLAWGKPVITNPMAYTRRYSLNTGRLFVSIAGPIMNLLMATAVSAVVVLGVRTGLMPGDIAIGLIRFLVVLNLYLMFFNLLPIPPLDGGAVLAWFLPRSMQHIVDVLERWGFLILLGLLMTGILDVVMRPAALFADFWVRSLLGIAAL